MELLFFLIPSFLHGWLMGEFSFTETEEDRQKKPVKQGITWFESGNIPAAFRFFQENEPLYPKCAYLFFYRGKCHAHFENFEAAIPDFEKALRLETTVPDFYVELAKAYAGAKRLEEAISMFKRASRMYLDQSAEIERNLGEVQLQKGDYAAAYANFKSAEALGDSTVQELIRKVKPLAMSDREK
ncbi:MAG: tetratricopeptide repeat protein [Spirosomataceae bacterium]